MKKIAIVYDWIDKWGGVERILLVLAEIFPQAVFYTSYFNQETAVWAEKLKIKTSFIQYLPNLIKTNRILSLPFYPFAFESFNLNEYETVISVTSSFAKSVITRPETKHICYLLTPTRFLWSHRSIYIKYHQWGIKNYLNYLKNWDLVAAQRPDKIISISETVKKRCKKYYGRESEVIYPPFDIQYWTHIKDKKSEITKKYPVAKILKEKKFFLIVSRLERYKKLDLAIEVFNRRNDYLVIVGKGSEENCLKKKAKNNILFLSELTDYELADLYSKAEALIMPQEEDFGYVALEAQFFGCPVIAFNKGGVTETVLDGKTGIFFAEQNSSSLFQALERFAAISYNLKIMTKNLGVKITKKFSKEIFVKNFIKTINFHG